jgi:cation-transporting ATPase 13A3/4/5
MNFAEISRQSARDGIYQLAMATSTYKGDKAMNEVHRDDIEKDLEFLGFVNFQNSLKEDSPAVIEELRHGKIGCVMITVREILSSHSSYSFQSLTHSPILDAATG